MIVWKSYRERSKSDLAASRRDYEAADYGNAAYHAQQAVEKYCKAILFKGSYFSDPIMSHIPMAKFAHELVPLFQKPFEIAKKHRMYFGGPYEKKQAEYLHQCQKIMKILEQPTHPTKIAIWKNSLGLPLEPNEERLFADFPHFLKCKWFNLEQTIAFTTDSEKASRFEEEAKRDPELKKWSRLMPVAQLGRIIVATFPHEDIGRYPTEIDTGGRKESSVELYKRQRQPLADLIDTVAESIN